ncbi:MAG: substrate-binding domain-containing protein [Pirellulaceae bacterium]
MSYVATDNRNGGKKAARRLAEVMGDEGEVILLRYKEGARARCSARRASEEMAQHPNITVVSSDQYGGDSVSTAKTKVEQLLLAHPNARGLFAVCESNANGALEAILDSGRGDAIHFVAFDPSERLIDALKSGDCDGIVLQNPVAMGHESVMAMVRHLEGQKVESNVPTGEEVATVENMEEPRMQSLLNPPISR